MKYSVISTARRDTDQMRRAITLICAGLMLLALAPLPIGYYTFLRIATTFGALVVIASRWESKGFDVWAVLFGLLVILFNPIIPIYLGDRSLWAPINIIGAILFAVASLFLLRGNTARRRSGL